MAQLDSELRKRAARHEGFANLKDQPPRRRRRRHLRHPTLTIMLKPINPSQAVESAHNGQSLPVEVINELFKVLHGRYGQLFLSKYATGRVNDQGHDMGVISARQVWAHDLRGQTPQAVKGAIERMRTDYPEFPPSGPQFLALCNREARDLQGAQEVEQARLRLPASGRAHSDATKAAREAALAKIAEHTRLRKPAEESGINALKSLVAEAIALAGGDQVRELRRLDFMFAPKESHA